METRKVRDLVDIRVSRLQSDYLAGNRPRASAAMAALRHAVGREPGEVPGIWNLTIAGVRQGVGDDPSPDENAVHDAIVLYALHQQSRSRPMHQRGASLGRSVRQLAGLEEQPAIRRRFDAAVTAQSYNELRYHLRGLVSLLRSADISTDYGELASDLLDFQREGGVVRVRRRWARDFSARFGEPSNGEDTENDTNLESKEEEFNE